MNEHRKQLQLNLNYQSLLFTAVRIKWEVVTEMLNEPTCQSQLERAEVTAKLVAGRDHQLADVRASDSLQLQCVLIVVWHAHLTRPRFVDQHHPPPEEHRDSISQLQTSKQKPEPISQEHF